MNDDAGLVDDLVQARHPGGGGGPGRAVRPAPRPAPADDPAPPRPPAPGACRPLRRAPGCLSSTWPPSSPSTPASPRSPSSSGSGLVVGERLLRVHRHHLGAAMRDAGREISLHQGTLPEASSASLAAQLLGQITSASRAALRAEMQVLLQEALNGMDPIDREVIALRHFEELTNDEVAAVLGLTKAAASKRYVRAMLRLKAAIGNIPGPCRRVVGRRRGPDSPTRERDRSARRTRGSRTLLRIPARAETHSTRWAKSSSIGCAGGSGRPSASSPPAYPGTRGRDPRLPLGPAARGSAQAPGRRDRRRRPARVPPGRGGPRAARRLPDLARAGPRRDGRRLRGRAGVARPSRRA